jgi:single-strand DNA-binding protein
MNKVILIGNLGHAPKVSYSQNNMAIARMSLATNERVKGEDRTEWHRLVAFDKTAEVCGKHLDHGSKIAVDGRLQTRTYEDRDGVKKTVTEVIVNRVEFLGGGRKAEDAAPADKPSGDQPPQDNDVNPADAPPEDGAPMPTDGDCQDQIPF